MFTTTTWSSAAIRCISIAFLCVAVSSFAVAQSVSTPTTATQQEFIAALTAADAAQRELQSGNAAAYKAIWSQSERATLIGGFGGGVEKGWPNVSRRIDWVALQFSKGTNTIERLVTHSDGQIGCVVQTERIRFQIPGQTTESTRDYRVTMLFIHEPEGWKLVHRHADSQGLQQAPK